MSLELEKAFDSALTQVARLLRTGEKTVARDFPRAQLERLETELLRERTSTLERGTVDREWFQKTIRWVVEWVPDDELTLLAALGGIVRVKQPGD